MRGKTGLGIIGSGEAVLFLLETIKEYGGARVLGLAGHSQDGPETALARKLGVPLYDDYKALALSPDIELIVNLSADPEVGRVLDSPETTRARLLHPLGGWLLGKLMEETRLLARDAARHLAEQEALFSAGMMLASAAGVQQTLDLIVESALNSLDMDAGTLAMFDEEGGVMRIKARAGFAEKIPPVDYEWKPRPSGLTGQILAGANPMVIEDMDAAAGFDAKPIREMGVRSMIAAPLRLTGRIVGILYVDGFKPRKFTSREVNTLNLLALQAAAAIDKAMLLEKAELMAITDGLTKLHSHRFFVRALEREVRRSQRYGSTLAVLMLDVDHFNVYNQAHGHVRGNIILTTLADILKRSARDTDVVARWGGEEFAVILTETPREKAEIVAKRIRKEVEETYFPGADVLPTGKLTVSMGVATFPEDSDHVSDLSSKAQQALYRSKEMGRNQVTMYDKEWDMGRK
jgi:diguanylate cyclase (GGDEF)-like protein